MSHVNSTCLYMPILYGSPINSSNFRNACIGYYLEENLENAGSIEVTSRIASEYSVVAPSAPTGLPLVAVVVPITFINSYDSGGLKVFNGNPPRTQFGSLTMRHSNLTGDYLFVQYEAQAHPAYISLLGTELVDYPSDMSALPSFEQFSAIWSCTFNTFREPLTNMSARLGISAINYDLSSSVNANIGFYYLCSAGFVAPPGGSILLAAV